MNHAKIQNGGGDVEEVVIIDALRTAVGKFHGQFEDLSAVELGTQLVQGLLARHESVEKRIDQVIFGNVLQAGTGQNPARQIALKSGLSETIIAFTVNEVCGSGMKAVALGRQAICMGEAEVVIAGGIESMSQAPHVTRYDKMTDSFDEPTPIMLLDGLTDALSGKHMGLTAENVAEKFQIDRQEQDLFSLRSQLKASVAQEKGYFDQEIWPIQAAGREIQKDEGIRPETSLKKLSGLKTAFKEGGTVTAGNASTINDGAAAMILTSKRFAEEQGWPYLAVIKDITEVAIDPAIMGISPVTAVQKLIERNAVTLSDIDLFEINEAFAATSVAVERKLELPAEKINVVGGSISIGHAIGATGARIITTAIHQLQRIKGRYAIASLCVGGGLGLAILLERPQKIQSDQKFYQLTTSQRLERLSRENKLSRKTRAVLEDIALSEQIASHLIENQISEIELPLGLVLDLPVNGKKYNVPLATEEPSVVAACNNGAKMVTTGSGFTSHMNQKELRGQIVFYEVEDPKCLKALIEAKKNEIFLITEKAYPSIVKRGGGLKKIAVREFPEVTSFLSLDLIVDTKDAMGANIMNTILEVVAGQFSFWTDEKILFSILSNYNQEALVTVSCEVPFESLAKENGEEVAQKISKASLMAQIDPIRATTHNKGIMNGIEGVILACGNDTRAVNATVHAYASQNGKYQGLSQWQVSKKALKGTMTLPLSLATVGGATKVLPKAKAAFEILGIKEAKEFAEIVAAIGLAQNLAALKALVTDGIQKGHMALQAKSLAMSQGATGVEIEQVAKRLQTRSMNANTAQKILDELRNKKR